jgi:DNA integrity scanning protein DisA with diadenylate cyclase activity
VAAEEPSHTSQVAVSDSQWADETGGRERVLGRQAAGCGEGVAAVTNKRNMALVRAIGHFMWCDPL